MSKRKLMMRREDETAESWGRRIEAEGKRMAQKPGRSWRVLAHHDKPHDGENSFRASDEGTFDELVVDHWFHLEQMDTRAWWMRVGEHNFWITIPRSGAPAVVSHYEIGKLDALVDKRRGASRGGR